MTEANLTPYGRGYWDRTSDLTPPRRARYHCAKPRNLIGGADRARTDHLSNANAALYQMSYCPILLLYDKKNSSI